MRVVKGTYIINQGDQGDRFYVVIKGVSAVEIASETPIPDYQPKSKFHVRLNSYLSFLYDNFEKIYWRRVPYALRLKHFLLKLKKLRSDIMKKGQQIPGSIQKSASISLEGSEERPKIMVSEDSIPNTIHHSVDLSNNPSNQESRNPLIDKPLLDKKDTQVSSKIHLPTPQIVERLSGRALTQYNSFNSHHVSQRGSSNSLQVQINDDDDLISDSTI